MYVGKIVELADRERLYAQPAPPLHPGAALGDPDPRSRRSSAGASGSSSPATSPRPSTRRRGCRFHTRCPIAFERCTRRGAGVQAVRRRSPRRVPLGRGTRRRSARPAPTRPGRHRGRQIKKSDRVAVALVVCRRRRYFLLAAGFLRTAFLRTAFLADFLANGFLAATFLRTAFFGRPSCDGLSCDLLANGLSCATLRTAFFDDLAANGFFDGLLLAAFLRTALLTAFLANALFLRPFCDGFLRAARRCRRCSPHGFGFHSTSSSARTIVADDVSRRWATHRYMHPTRNWGFVQLGGPAERVERAARRGPIFGRGLTAESILEGVLPTRGTSVAKPLIIVESPTKAKTIKKFLPPRYVVKASVGPRPRPAQVDARRRRRARFHAANTSRSKARATSSRSSRRRRKSASDVYLATDPDREGEAIAWHLAELLKLENPKRIELHEITKDAALRGDRRPARDRHAARQRAAGAPDPRPARRLQNLAAAVGQGPRRPLGRARAVGRGAADRRPRARDQRVRPARVLVDHGAAREAQPTARRRWSSRPSSYQIDGAKAEVTDGQTAAGDRRRGRRTRRGA